MPPAAPTPLSLEGIRDRFPPERTRRARQNKKVQSAVLAAAALHGGTEPGLLDEIAHWKTDDFWQYALFPTVAYIRRCQPGGYFHALDKPGTRPAPGPPPN